MNKRLIAIVLGIAIVLLAVTMGIKNIMLKRSFRRLKMTSERVEIIYDYGLSLYSQKDYDKAIKAFEIVAKQKLDTLRKEDALFKLAEIYKKQNNLEKTRDIYKEIIQEFPNSKSISKVQKDFEELNMKILFSQIITEDSFRYEIKSHDTLGKIAKNYNTTVELLKKSNALKSDKIIPGRHLKVVKGKFSILVDKSQNKLFLKKDGEIIKIYKVSTGANNSTPVGRFLIEEKLVRPVWFKIGAIVQPDSPEYELGNYWLGISERGYGIHGTKDSNSIGKHITKGCVRLINKDVEEIYVIVPSGSEVVIVD